MVLGLLVFFGETILPLCIILKAYFDVFLAIKSSIKFALEARSENLANLKRMKKINIMTALVSALVVVSWLPNNLFFILLSLGFVPRSLANDLTGICTSLLVFLNSCINPFLYVFLIPEFRDAFVKLIFRNSQTNNTRS